VTTDTGRSETIYFEPDVTTLGDIDTLLNSSPFMKMTGTWNPADTIPDVDAFGPTLLTGGVVQGPIGSGATVTTFDGRPVWDRLVQVDGKVTDSIHSMTTIIDSGGVPYAVGTASQSDWGRTLLVRRAKLTEFQWFKLFVATVRGRQRAFWVPSWRDDFNFVSKATNTITVSSTDGSDVFAWWPAQRSRIQILQADETVTYAHVTAVADNHDGTVTMTIGTTISGSHVVLVSWLELCRFENDDFDVTFEGHRFSTQPLARVVQV
jgi:hypothetical protein